MRKHDAIVFSVFDFAYLAASCLLASLLGFLVVWGVNLVYDFGFVADTVIRTVAVGLGAVGLCSVLAYYDGYRYANFTLVGYAVPALIAAAVHFALGLVLRFPPVLFGATKHLSGLIAFGQFYNAERMAKIPFGTLALVGVIMMLVYVAAFVLSAKLGCAKRLRDREETVNGQTASK